jgi:glutathione S-transferase
MTLKLHYHPLSSYCHKVLIALYENETPFEPVFVDLGDAASRAAFLKVWPIGKFPVIEDTSRNWVVPESSIVIEYLQQHYPGKTRFIPGDADLARQVRMRDRFFDLHIHTPLQKVIGDALRAADKKDPYGVEQAISSMRLALRMVEEDIGSKTWLMGDAFTLADCSAAPALFYSNRIVPLATEFPGTETYLKRLMERPSYARTLKEAEPYLHLVPR